MNKITSNKMQQDYTQQKRYIRAQKRVKEIKGFYTHFAVYCLVTPLIIFVNLTFVPQFHWFWFSVFGWGLGIFFHWLAVFGFHLIGFGKNWEQKKIKEFMIENNK